MSRLHGRLGRLEQETPAPPAPTPVWCFEELVWLPPRLLRLLCDLHCRPDPAAVAELARLPYDVLYRRVREVLREGHLGSSGDT